MHRDVIGIDAELALLPDVDPRAAGGEVTVALCGHWDHDGPCRWPHNSRIDTDISPAHLRSVIVVPGEDRDEVVRRVEVALRGDERWTVERFTVGAIYDDEQALAQRLAQNTST
jgi:hypothetical protein